MKLSLYIIVGSLAFVPVIFADEEEAAPQESPAAQPEGEEAAPEGAPAEASSEEAAPTEGSSTESASASTGKSNPEELKLEEEKASDQQQGTRLLSSAARENMIKINDTVREINTQQRGLYEKKMGIDAELETFTSAFADRRGRLMAVADSVNDYVTTQNTPDDAHKANDEARQKRADFLKQAVASLSDFRSSLSELAIKDKVLEQQDEALGVVLSKSLEDLNTAVKTAAEAQKQRNEVFAAATDDAVAQAEAAIVSALTSVQQTLTHFKDDLAKDIDGKIVALKDAIKSMNEALDQTQKKGDALKALLKNIEVQDGLLGQAQKLIAQVTKTPAVGESTVASVTDKAPEKDKTEVAQAPQKSESWLSWLGAKAQGAKDYVFSFIYSPAKKEVLTAVTQPVVTAQANQGPQPATAVPAPAQDAQPHADQSVAAVPGAAAPTVVVPSVAGQPVAPTDASALSPKNPAREEDMKQVQTVGKALGKSIARAWAAIGSFFSDIKHGLFEPSDTSNDDARPVAAKTVTIQSKQDSATPVSPRVEAPAKTEESAPASPVVAG